MRVEGLFGEGVQGFRARDLEVWGPGGAGRKVEVSQGTDHKYRGSPPKIMVL